LIFDGMLSNLALLVAMAKDNFSFVICSAKYTTTLEKGRIPTLNKYQHLSR